uniref:Zinc finger CCHC domain-containing protein 2 n=1 Tax=Lygus hesperus TaxID=30085 RepID=A0A0A9W3R0_LYGHE
MVCKKDVVNWFKNSKSYKRIDVMCTLLNLCVPIELRFLGTCLEHLGKRDFHELRSSENEANNSSELSSSLEGQCIASQHFRTKLAIYISVLHSCNYASSGAVFKILTKTEDLSPILKNSSDETALDDLLLLYTLALNHPAFSFEQKLTLEKISSQLVEEERRLSRKSSSQGPYTQDVEKTVVPPMQAYHPACISLEDGHLISVATSPQIGSMPPVPHHPGDPGVGVHDGGGALRLTYPPPQTQLILNTGTWTMVGPPGGGNGGGTAQTDSPLASRTSSPCSRPGSPQPVPSPASRSKFPPPRVPPPPLSAGAVASDAALRETIGKELPKYVTSLQSYSSEQLIRFTDEELREIGLTPPAIGQLRSILAPKQHAMTNGIGPQPQHIIEVISPQGPIPKKKDQEPEVMRRYPMEGLAVYPAPPFMCHQPPHHTTCYSCYPIPGGRKALPLHYMAAGPPPSSMPPHYPPVNNVMLAEGLRSLRIGSSVPPEDHTSSDTGSDHSPPDTPAPPVQGTGGMPVSAGEMQNDERLDERRGSSRRGGMSRSRANPPGVQSAPRGRGANSVHRRRDMGGISNGNSSTSSNASGSNGGGGNGGGGGEPPGPVPPGSYFGYMTAPYIRPPYPAYHHHPAAYVRHGPYPTAYHNGTELVYHQYPPPGTPGAGPPPQPPPGTFIPGPPPPAVPQYSQPPIMKQVSCYNCGSQSHQAVDCPDPTIEEVTKQGQYRIDFASTPYPKQSEADK